MKRAVRVISLAVILLALLAGLGSCKALIRWWGGVQKEEIVHRGTSQVGNYEWYFDQYHACKATAVKVKLAEGQDDEQRMIKMVLAGMVEEYNSRSRMQWTRATWKSPELPYQIDMEDLLK